MGGDHRDCEFLLPDGRVMTTDGDIRAPISEATFRRLLEHVLPHDAGLDDVIVRALDALEADTAQPGLSDPHFRRKNGGSPLVRRDGGGAL